MEVAGQARASWRLGAAAAAVVIVLVICCSSTFDHHYASLLDEHRWECTATALDHVGVPMSWGLTSAIQRAESLQARLAHEGARVGAPVATWALRSWADGVFLPVDECAALAEAGPGVSQSLLCARGLAYALLVALDHFETAMVADGTTALAGAALVGASGERHYEVLVHALKLAAVLVSPDPTVAYFVSGQIQLGADVLRVRRERARARTEAERGIFMQRVARLRRQWGRVRSWWRTVCRILDRSPRREGQTRTQSQS